MLITKVEIFRANLPLKRSFRIAIGTTTVTETLFLRVHTDVGPYGMGEVNTVPHVVGETQGTALAAAQKLAQELIGTEALDIESRVKQLKAALPRNSTVRSGFDMALYDLLGKQAGLPLYKLLGGPKRPITTDNTVGIDTPEAMAAIALEFKQRGFTAIKIKLGTTVAEDVARVAAIRAAVGPDILLRTDANQGWNRVAALQALRQLERFDIQYCEQPVRAWDVESLALINAASPIPIMADEALFDEHDAINLLRANACSYFNIKLAKSGGIHVALKINAIGEAAGLNCMVGCMTETRLGLTAAAHLVSARPNIVFADLDGADMLRDDPVTGGMTYGAGGVITLPDGPGIGADIAPDYLGGLETQKLAA
ncbi:MAG: mandelate racemase/muconate lactonizing enzyme family protein [Devosia sp.]